ncbi:MAG TPA: SagB family peptide dehydrogenase, partial [Chloroflexota bacterium]
MPFKVYTTLEPVPLPLTFDVSGPPTSELNLSNLSRLTYFSNGVTRVLRGMAFRAAACTGALFHIELYLVSGELDDLAAGVYHYGAHDNALRRLRAGDFRRCVIDATGGEAAVSEAPVVLVLTSTWWRNAWKYEARAYRHAFWDGGTVLANLLSVASGQDIRARVVVGFADPEVNRLLDVDPSQEAAIALVAVGRGSAPEPATTPAIPALGLPTRRLSPRQVDYPEIIAAHAASSLADGAAAAHWRAQQSPPLPPQQAPPLPLGEASSRGDGGPRESIERVILRRGSSRRFSHAAISREQLQTLLVAATSPFEIDAFVACDLYLIVNAVEDLAPGAYVLNRGSRELQLLHAGDFRRQATYLDLGQPLAGDAALNAYWLVNLEPLDDRAYRAAQLSAAIEAGKLYLAAYALGLGATGLTFFDDDVTH